MVLMASSIDEPAIRRKYNAGITEAYERFSLAIAPFKAKYNSKMKEVELEYARLCTPATEEYLKTVMELNARYRKEVGLSPVSTAPSASVD